MESFVRAIVASVAACMLMSCTSNHRGLPFYSTGTGGRPDGGGLMGGDGGFLGGSGGPGGSGGRGGSSAETLPGLDGGQDASVAADGNRDTFQVADAGKGGAIGGTAGTGGVGGMGGTSSTCQGANTCNWCAGSMEMDSFGCFARWRCANGADPCKVNPCYADSGCPSGQTCRDRLCWPGGSTGGSRGPDAGTGGGHGGSGGAGAGGGGADGGQDVRDASDGASKWDGGNPSGVGMACATTADCPTGTRCCDGTDLSCDGTRVPLGDGTNPGEWVVASDGLTVTDTITGLSWQRSLSTQTACNNKKLCTWVEAKAFCDGLTLGGLSDWRLPSVKELRTIVDFTRAPAGPTIDPTAFPEPWSGHFLWTASTEASGQPIIVGLGNGFYSALDADAGYEARCVRGSRCFPTTRFVVRDGGLVYDSLTDRLWQRDGSGPRRGCGGPDQRTCTWAEAAATCDALELGGFSDFRLPTAKEMDSIVDRRVPLPGPTIDATAFPDTPVDARFWTSTPTPTGANAWSTDFRDGSCLGAFQTDRARVRCVR